jgi:hypothetical protein
MVAEIWSSLMYALTRNAVMATDTRRTVRTRPVQ